MADDLLEQAKKLSATPSWLLYFIPSPDDRVLAVATDQKGNLTLIAIERADLGRLKHSTFNRVRAARKPRLNRRVILDLATRGVIPSEWLKDD